MIPGETILSGAAPVCPSCNTKAEWGVYRSAAGWYIGTYCACGPYTRESLSYFRTKEEAEQVFLTFEER